MKKLFENWRRFTNESMGDPPEAEGWLQQAEMVMEEIVEEGHGTSVADDVDYAIYKVGEMDPAAEKWLTQNKNRVLALHPNRSMTEGVYPGMIKEELQARPEDIFQKTGGRVPLDSIENPYLSTDLKNPGMVNLVFKDSGDFYDGPFSREDAEDIIDTQDPRGQLEIEPVTSRQADLSDFEDAYEQGASPEDIIAMINRQTSN